MVAFLVYTVIVFSGGAYAGYAWKAREVHNILTVEQITDEQDYIRAVVDQHNAWLVEDRQRIDGLQRGYDSLAGKINSHHSP